MDSDDSLLAKIAASPMRAPPRGPILGTRRFELRRRLGTGSFGEVFEARDRESGASVAIKLLRASGPDRLFRFKREFRAVADIVHPNLVRLHELIQEDEQWYLTMELVDGLPFDEHLRRAPEQLRACFAQLAQAIDALHRARCIHRDIKPTNVLVERTGRVVLLDFGLAVALEAVAHTAIAGTPQYMAPEQESGGELTPASDWYAFGVMLYETLAGTSPFAVPGERLGNGKRESPDPPSTLRDGVDEGLERLCLALLAPDARDRPLATEILGALTAAEQSALDVDARAGEVEPFAGRARELEILHDVADAIDETGAVVLLEGQAGIGKTSLVRAFERDARAKHWLFFSGRCHEAESVPFKGLDAVVDAISDYLRRRLPIEAASVLPRHAHALATMFPVMKRVDAFAEARNIRDARRAPLEMRRAALEALRELITRLSDKAPVVVFVDDVQWATVDGLHLLFELLAPPTPPALFVLAYRSGAIGQTPALDRLLGRIDETPDIVERRLALSPLSPKEIDELIGFQGAAIDAASAWRETGGDPFLLSRLLRSSTERSSEVDLTRVLDDQLARLSEDAGRVLAAISLSAAALTQEAACLAAGLTRWDAAAIDELRRAKLIRSLGRNAGAAIEPYHDRVRERHVETLAPVRSRDLHRQLAEFLERDRRAEAEAIAHHYASAEDAEKAILWMRRAASDATESFAFVRAAELHWKASTLATDPNERINLLAEHAEAIVLAGRRNDAARACLDACEVARQSGVEGRVAELRARAGEHFMLGGDFRRGTELLREALAGVGVHLPTTTGVAMAQTLNMQVELVARGFEFTPRDESELSPLELRRVDLELAAARSLAQTDIRAPWLSVTALHDALDLGEPSRVQRGLAYFGFVNAARLADHPMSDLVLSNAETLARNSEDDAGLAWAIMARAFVLLYRRRIKGSAALLRDCERRFLSLSPPLLREAGIARIGLVTLGASYGHDLPFARKMAKLWVTEALEREDFTPATWLRLMSSWVELANDDVPAARETLRLAREAWSSVEDEIFTAAAIMAELAIAVYADPAAAWETTERIGVVFHRLFASMLPTPRLAFLRQQATSALCALQAGRASRDLTLERVRTVIDALGSNPNAGDTIELLRGHLAALEGDRSRAARLFRVAAAGLGREMQRVQELLALRLAASCSGEVDDALVAELRELGVAAPDRFGLVFVGPLPD